MVMLNKELLALWAYIRRCHVGQLDINKTTLCQETRPFGQKVHGLLHVFQNFVETHGIEMTQTLWGKIE